MMVQQSEPVRAQRNFMLGIAAWALAFLILTLASL
jgi:hypothetical protein